MQVQLIIEDGNHAGQIIPINTPSFTIGREKSCDLRSGSSQTSPQHCVIHINENVVTIRDLGSDTGTFVNGKKILSTVTIQDGDKIKIGRHTFVLSIQVPEEPAEPEDDTGVLFDIRLEGQRISVTKRRLLQLAQQGMILPDDVVTIDGTKVFADTIQDIVFGDKQPPKSVSQIETEPAVYTIQEAPVENDISPTDSVWNRFVDKAAGTSDIEPEPEIPLDNKVPDSDEDEADPFNIKDEPVVQVVLPSKTSKSVFSEIGDAIAPSLNTIVPTVSTEQKEMVRRYYKSAGYALGVLCLLGILGFLVSGSNSPPGIYYVEGTVLLDGVPVGGVSVTLNPRSEEGEPAGGMTDSKGRFTVTTGTALVGSGAKEGEYDITFRKITQDTEGLTTAEYAQKFGNRKPKTKYVIPQKYENADKSGLEVVKVVTEGSNKFKFELTSPPISNTTEVAKQTKNLPEKTPEEQKTIEIPTPTPLGVANTEEKRTVPRAASDVQRYVPPSPPAALASNNPSVPSSNSSEEEKPFIPSPVPPPITDIEEVPSISASQPPEIQYNVGLTFYRGTKEVSQDRAEALKWFYAAARQGHADAQYRVGTYFYFGWDVSANEPEAIDWFQKAADQGHKEAVEHLKHIERQKEIFGTTP